MAKSMSVNHIVTEAMYQYDHNKNGVIDLKRPEGFWNKVKNPDERVRSNTTLVKAFDSDKLTVSSSVNTYRDLFYTADADHNGQVTREELLATVKAFDKDGDGELKSRGFWGWLTRKPKGELDYFRKELGERLTRYSSVDI